jgi:hypothetical protein
MLARKLQEIMLVEARVVPVRVDLVPTLWLCANSCSVADRPAASAGRSRCLSGGRAGRHRPAGGQWAHRCRLYPRTGHFGGEPAWHDVLKLSLICSPLDDSLERFSGCVSIPEATERAHLAATKACSQELAATGADLGADNSTESAADFVDLRKVLGIAVWNVYGTSCGSYLAQTLIRNGANLMEAQLREVPEQARLQPWMCRQIDRPFCDLRLRARGLGHQLHSGPRPCFATHSLSLTTMGCY